MTQTNEVFEEMRPSLIATHKRLTLADRILAPLKHQTEYAERLHERYPDDVLHAMYADLFRAVFEDCAYAAHLEGYEVDKAPGKLT